MRKLSTLVISALSALALASTAAASNGGGTPVSPISPNGEKATSAYWLILIFTGLIFVLVEGALIAFVIRFRSKGRARTEEGPDIHGSTKLETAWTIAPVVILAVIAVFIFISLPGFNNPAAADEKTAVHVNVIAHQFYWEFRYEDGPYAFDTMTVPVDRLVELTIQSEDVAHSFWIPAIGPKQDAIPGKTNHLWFKANRTGTFKGQCAELCGLLHAKMTQAVTVVSQDEYAAWLQRQASLTPVQLGKQIFDASCAKCHGALAEGFVGPNIQQSSVPKSLKTLRPLMENGLRKMPAVGSGLTDEELLAIAAYFRSNPFTEASSGK